ncbi:alpha/beta fold hydrolase [Microlunatus sp. Y2014]|uniref:alpha/beta fold hydrolase n=1 Tax=Microlunatus sp. Y2014 TaxID=3418488 RepID=UPI003DA71BE4
MTTYVLIHGAGDGAWSWHLVARALESVGHDVVAPDLPADDDSATLEDYRDAAVDAVHAAVGLRRHAADLVVVGHSFGAFTAPLVADRLAVDRYAVAGLVLVAGMLPTPGESPNDWWETTGYTRALQEQSVRDGGLTGHPDPYVSYYQDVPRELAEEALSRERDHPSPAALTAPWPLAAWPDVPTRFLLCRDDRFFPADFFRRLVSTRLGIEPDEIPGGHCISLSRPDEVAAWLVGTGTTER